MGICTKIGTIFGFILGTRFGPIGVFLEDLNAYLKAINGKYLKLCKTRPNNMIKRQSVVMSSI